MSIEGGIVIRARARGCIWVKQNGNQDRAGIRTVGVRRETIRHTRSLLFCEGCEASGLSFVKLRG